MYQGKLFSVLGDSISTLGGCSEPADAAYYDGIRKFDTGVFSEEDTWWGQVIAHFGGELLANNSISGSLVAHHEACVAPTYGCSDERTAALGRKGIAPDVILILMGVNDWGWEVRLRPKEGEAQSDALFSVAYDLMLKKLKNHYPYAELWCFTLPINAKTEAYYGGGVEGYNGVIRDCAKAHGARTVELYRPDLRYEAIDNLHPTATGMRRMAEVAIRSLESR